jgi:hypothetical protein
MREDDAERRDQEAAEAERAEEFARAEAALERDEADAEGEQ